MMRFRKLTTEHPYLLTAVLFLMILLGGLSLSWPNEYYAFLLLLYFLVSIGIKLDGISNQLALVCDLLPRLLDRAETKDHVGAETSADSTSESRTVGGAHRQ